MKKNLSGNTWGGSAWDGVSVYGKQTQEYVDGKYVTVTADFRKYSCVEDSIADHSAYLLGAVDGKKLRYEGLKGCTDYQKAVQIIKDGGYATSPDYVEKLCTIIERWELTKWDVKDAVSVADGGGMANGDCPFLVKVSIPDLNIRKGAGTGFDYHKKNGNPLYTGAGVFTIVKTKDGQGASSWGLLKSYAEKEDVWISLDYTTRV